MGFQEYDVVRVVSLIESDRRYDGSANVMREPRVGDTGTIVSIGSNVGACIVEWYIQLGLLFGLLVFRLKNLNWFPSDEDQSGE